MGLPICIIWAGLLVWLVMLRTLDMNDVEGSQGIESSVVYHLRKKKLIMGNRGMS
jgi:hypothetical protein